MTIVHAVLTFAPCGHVVHYTTQAQWRRVGDRVRCPACSGRLRRLVTYSESPVIWIDADPTDT